MRDSLLCRNCNSSNVIEAPNGILCPFFILRVIGKINARADSLYDIISKIAISKKTRLRRYIAKIFVRIAKKLPFLERTTSALRPNAEASLSISIRICKDCTFVGPSPVYPLHQLVGLYKDYRSNTYNKDRCSVEPEYKSIINLVGKCQEEIDARISNLDMIIGSHTDCRKIQTILDWGGGEGRFIPSSLKSKHVTILDYSTEQLADPSFSRLDQLNTSQKYDYIQVCHVLEHVSEPRLLMLEAVSHLNLGGYIYVELPQDRPSNDLNEFASNTANVQHWIHEHLNLYSQQALEKLGQSLGLRSIYLGTSEFNFGWTNATIISGLFAKDT